MGSKLWVSVLAAVVAATACGSGSDEITCPPRAIESPAAALAVGSLGDPVWTQRSDEASFSSPRVADLNGDGVADVVQGFGQDTLGEQTSSVVATNGATGTVLWQSGGHEDLIGSATFAALGGDETPDVVIGGRRGALLAFDGATGEQLWSFDDQGGRWFNFYTSQIVDDQNGDGVVDVVAANGGLVFEEPEEGGGIPDDDKRKLGTVFLISGHDGSVIGSQVVPDRGESYMSPVLIASSRGQTSDVLVGTGGETLAGALWRLPLESLVDSQDAPAERIVDGGLKGMIATPSLADLTGDCVLDIVSQSFDGTVAATDALTNERLWSVTNPGFETYSTPTLGFFVGDDAVPDVFTSVARGVWPEYESSDYLLIDGSTGQVVWRETLGVFAPSGFVAADLNQDDRDEIIFGVNKASGGHQLYVLHPATEQLTALGDALPQSTFAAPWLGDIDGDSKPDLLVTESAYDTGGVARTHRYELGWATTSERPSWGGYLGTDATGSLVMDN